MLRIKEGFKDERFVSLPDTLLDAYAADPLVGNLYLRKIGYFPRVKYHYVLKQQGCDYAMLLYCTEGEGVVPHRQTTVPAPQEPVCRSSARYPL